jgi:hypothetical protein
LARPVTTFDARLNRTTGRRGEIVNVKTQTVQRSTRAALVLCTSLIVLAGPQAPSSSAAACANEAIREAQVSSALPEGSVHLPDCMALEMVSPPRKAGQRTKTPEISADGERVLFTSKAALADTPGLNAPLGDFYLATRGPDGWITAPTSPPSPLGGFGTGEPLARTPDLGRWLTQTGSENSLALAEFGLFEGGLGGLFEPVAWLSPLNGPLDAGSVTKRSIEGVSTDFSHVVFTPGGNLSAKAFPVYLPGDPVPSAQDDPNAYMVARQPGGGSELALLARDSGGKAWGGTCGSSLGGAGRTQGAISADGTRTFFTTRPAQAQPEAANLALPACDTSNPMRILERTETPSGPQIAEIAPGGPAARSDFFEGASIDGSRLYFTTTRSLEPGDTDAGPSCGTELADAAGCDLYLREATPSGSTLSRVSTGTGAEVLRGLTAISTDGSRAYFVARGVLTAGANPEGDSAQVGEPNLYLYDADAETTAFIGTVSANDNGALFGARLSYFNGATAVPLKGLSGGDGHVLAFESFAPLTGEDLDGDRRDIFRYDAEAGTLQCASCSASSGEDDFDVARPVGEFRAPLTDFAESHRWASEDGGSIVIVTREGLDSGDSDERTNPYLWRNGVLTRLPGVVAKVEGLEFNDSTISADGTEVAFLSNQPLLPADGDGVEDVYVARAGGGFSEPPPLPPCDPLKEGACQAAPSGAPGALGPAFSGPGNVKAKRSCPKGKRLVKARCVKKKARATNPKRHHKHASRKQGDSK